MKNWLEDLNKTLGLGLILAFIVFLIRGYYGILGEIGFWAFLFRWIHVVFGILWIGLLYYFNFVQIPSTPKISDEQSGCPAGSSAAWPGARAILEGAKRSSVGRGCEGADTATGAIKGDQRGRLDGKRREPRRPPPCLPRVFPFRPGGTLARSPRSRQPCW